MRGPREKALKGNIKNFILTNHFKMCFLRLFMRLEGSTPAPRTPRG